MQVGAFTVHASCIIFFFVEDIAGRRRRSVVPSILLPVFLREIYREERKLEEVGRYEEEASGVGRAATVGAESRLKYSRWERSGRWRALGSSKKSQNNRKSTYKSRASAWRLYAGTSYCRGVSHPWKRAGVASPLPASQSCVACRKGGKLRLEWNVGKHRSESDSERFLLSEEKIQF
ncbi:hypothetical protein BHE74_00027719 [Ensete ventricosum]|nr:hypothetical protein GW17_00014821 [Ensete ventricosum]RWW65027.1 hypothetical protein BHE74_00027719 [Ensete ventricosum]